MTSIDITELQNIEELNTALATATSPLTLTLTFDNIKSASTLENTIDILIKNEKPFSSICFYILPENEAEESDVRAVYKQISIISKLIKANKNTDALTIHFHYRLKGFFNVNSLIEAWQENNILKKLTVYPRINQTSFFNCEIKDDQLTLTHSLLSLKDIEQLFNLKNISKIKFTWCKFYNNNNHQLTLQKNSVKCLLFRHLENIDTAIIPIAKIISYLNLEHLEFEETELSDNQLKALTSNINKTTALRKLNIINNRTSSDTINSIADLIKKLPNLKELHLHHQWLSTLDLLPLKFALQEQIALTQIEFHAQKKFRRLKAFFCDSYSDSNSDSDNEQQVTYQSRNEIDIFLQSNRLLDKLLLNPTNQVLGKYSGLYFDGRRLAVLLQHHEKYHYKSLTLENCTLSDNAITELSNYLKHNGAIEVLAIINSNLGDSQLNDLTEGLEQNTYITKLNFAKNRLTSNTIINLCQILKSNNCRIFELDVSKNAISDSNMNLFAEAIKHHSTLIRIDLSGNNISGSSIALLGAGLAKNNIL